MRRIRYAVAMSLDGFIAGPKGEADWIITDPELDFNAIFSQFDTLLIGRVTFDTMVAAGQTSMPGMKSVVFSRTLRQEDHPGVTIVRDTKSLASLKSRRGKDIWLFGGGALFSSLAEEGLVDTVEVTIIPILLGGGVPLAASPANRIKLALKDHKVYKTGIMSLSYAIR